MLLKDSRSLNIPSGRATHSARITMSSVRRYGVFCVGVGAGFRGVVKEWGAV